MFVPGLLSFDFSKNLGSVDYSLKLKKSLSLNNPCNLLKKLFYTLVDPVMLCRSGVWGVVKIYKDSDPYEHLHRTFVNRTNIKFN